MRRKDAGRLVLASLIALALVAPAGAAAQPDVARYILPPGEFGGLPTNAHSLDQLPLYDNLTPLRGRIDFGDIRSHFLPEDFSPIGRGTKEPTGEPGLKIIRDRYGVAHVYGKTRGDVMFGSGWVTAEDRTILLVAGRGPARAAVADVPGLDAFSLVTSARSFVPSAAAERLVTRQRKLIVKTYGDKGRQVVNDARNYARGINAYWKKAGIDQPPWTANDVIAVTAFIGSIFGAGGGQEVRNSDLLAKLRASLGGSRGTKAWEDLMEGNDPEAPTTIRRRFDYPERTGGPVEGSLVIDPGSAQLAAAPPPPTASNFLLADAARSKTGDPMAVMGPQLGFFYPEIVYQIDLHGPGIQAQGSAVPGLGSAILIGRTPQYAWSLTSADNDVRDQFLERLCNPDGSAPTRGSDHYLYKGHCRAMRTFDAGTLDGTTELRYHTTVHGPVQGTATVNGAPYAIARQRSTFGRDGLNLVALHDMTAGAARTPRDFWRIANEFGFTFNWAYVSRRHTAYFSSGLLPRRARGLDRFLPTLGTGRYDWQGFLSERQHPHDLDPPGGLFLNWNNKSAPGFMHGDDVHSYGSVQRVEMFNRFPRKPGIDDVASVMNRAATQDLRVIEVWPVIHEVLAGGPPPDALTGQAADLINSWLANGGSRIDSNLDGKVDDPGAAVMDAAWDRMADAVMTPVLGSLTTDLATIMKRDEPPYRSGGNGSSFGAGWYGYVDKDLRTLLGDPVKGRFNLRYCGGGVLAACRTSLWAALQGAAAQLASTQGPIPSAWRADATLDRINFSPGLISNTMRWTNRPTFQQVLRFDHP